MPDFSIIVPTAGAGDERGPYIDRCLEGVLATGCDVELLVLVTEGHRDLGRRLKEQYGARFGVTKGPFNFSKSLNAGAMHSSSPTLIFLNDDVEPGPMTSSNWLEVLASTPGDIVGATLFHDDGSVQHAGMAINAYGVPWHLEYRLYGYVPYDREVEAITGACIRTSKTIHETLGGFDERFTLCYSDTDYCLRARKKGLSVWISKAALVHHEWGTRGGPQTGMNDTRLWYQRWHDIQAMKDAGIPE